MNTINKNHKYILSIIIVLLIISCFLACKKNNSELYKVVTMDFYFPDSSPIIIEMNYKTDTMIYCASTYSLYNMLNIEFIDYKDFAEIIYQHIVKNKSIPIKKTLYDELYKNRIIENQKIKQIYDKHGIDYLLDIYVDDSGALFYSSGENKQHIKYEVAKYIIYLCFQHGIYFYWDDETGGLFVAK